MFAPLSAAEVYTRIFDFAFAGTADSEWLILPKLNFIVTVWTI
jgi:hypothetical protein